MSQTRPPPLSALNTLQRDWSSPKDASSDVVKPARPIPPPLTEEERAARLVRRRLLLSQVDDDSSCASSIKRSSPLETESERPLKRTALDEGIIGAGDATPKRPATVSISAKIVLSSEQQEILRLVTEGKNIFFTGSAGTGKSVLLKEILKSLRKKYARSPDAIAVTASTGIAACNIGGVTLHSFAGIGLGEGTAENLANRVKKNRKSSGRWMRTQVLIIDEISMVDGDLFDKLARIACLIKKTTRPFGGIQLIVCGDFFQLPPVSRGAQPTFAFEAKLWKDCVERTFNLTKVFRQKDQEFVDMLNEMRFGKLSQQSIGRFRNLSREIKYDDGIMPTELFPRREDVDGSNQRRMIELEGEYRKFEAIDGGSITDKDQRDKLLSSMMAPATLHLKINSQVMLIKNTDEALVNGSMGQVIDFLDVSAYSSRVSGGDESLEKKGKKKDDAIKNLIQYPLVRFPIPGTNQHREMLVQPETWKVELPSGEVQASRSQLPLILAWAMSIHKSQGQTLERVRVDLRRVFEKGQAYVALSRATSLDGLQVLGFDPTKVLAHPKVTEWSKRLETIN